MDRRVALFMGMEDHFDHGVARGVIRYAKEQKRWQLFGHGWRFSDLHDLKTWRGDGLIARIARQSDADYLSSLGVPVVDVAGAFTGRGFGLVTNDDVGTGTLAGEYLGSLGVEHFACCGVADVVWSRDRLSGFRGRVQAASEFVRPLDWWERLANEPTLVDFLTSVHRPAALFATNDSVALHVLYACRSAGIAVPSDLAVLGVDNDETTCELADPSLTSISLRLERIGYEAAAMLDAMMNGTIRETGVRRVESGALVERGSTRLFVTVDPVVNRALEVIHRSTHERMSVADVALTVPLSRRSLEIRFRRATGSTILETMTRARLNRAATLLRESNLKVAAVAAECGFGTVQRFFRLFRAAYGLSPGAYRKRERALDVRKM